MWIVDVTLEKYDRLKRAIVLMRLLFKHAVNTNELVKAYFGVDFTTKPEIPSLVLNTVYPVSVKYRTII